MTTAGRNQCGACQQNQQKYGGSDEPSKGFHHSRGTSDCMHWLVIKTQSVYVSYNFGYQYEALLTAIIMASGGSNRNQFPGHICLWLNVLIKGRVTI
jgi:hypothetical protein